MLHVNEQNKCAEEEDMIGIERRTQIHLVPT